MHRQKNRALIPGGPVRHSPPGEGGFIVIVILAMVVVMAGGIYVLDRINNREAATKLDQLSDGGRHENMSALSVVSAALSTMQYTTPATQVAKLGAPQTVPQFSRGAWVDPQSLKLSLDPNAAPSPAWSLDTAGNQFVVTLDDPGHGPGGAAGQARTVAVAPVPGSEEVVALENGIQTVGSVVFQATSKVAVPHSSTTRDVITKARINVEIPTDPLCWVEVLNQKPLFQIGEVVQARIMGRHGFFGYAQLSPEGGAPVQTMSLDDPAQLAAMENASTHPIGAATVTFPAPPPPDLTWYPYPLYYWLPKNHAPEPMQFYYQGLLPSAAQAGFQNLAVSATAVLAAHTGTGVAAGTTLQCTGATIPVNVHYNPPKACGCPSGYQEIKQIDFSCVCRHVWPLAGGLMVTLEASAEPRLTPNFAGSRLVGCFAPGTMIRLADGRDKAVEALTDADIVLNPKTGRQIEVKRRVAGPEAVPLVRVVTDKGKELTVTSGHPFLTARGLLTARRLVVGDQLGGERVKELLPVSGAPVTVWNLEVDTPSTRPEDHLILANGIVTGDLFLQEQLAKQQLAAAPPKGSR